MARPLTTRAQYRTGLLRVIGVVAAAGIWLTTFYLLRDVLPSPPRVVLDADRSQGISGFSTDGRILLTCTSASEALSSPPRAPLHLWDTATGHQVDEFLTPATDLWYAAITSDGRWLLVEEYTWPVIHIFDLETHEEIGTLAAPRDSQSYPPTLYVLPVDSQSDPPTLYLAPGSPTLAYRVFEKGEWSLRIVDIPSQRQLLDIPSFTQFDLGGCVAFTADGALVATVDVVGQTDERDWVYEIVIRDTRSGKEVARLTDSSGIAWNLRFSSDGQRLAANCQPTSGAHSPLSICVWDLPTNSITRRIDDATDVRFVDHDRSVVARTSHTIVRAALDADTKPTILYDLPHNAQDVRLLGVCENRLLLCIDSMSRNPLLAKVDDWLGWTRLQYNSRTTELLLDMTDGSTQPAPLGIICSPDGRIVVGNQQRNGPIVLYDLPPPSRAPRAAFWASVLTAAVLYATNRRWRRRVATDEDEPL